jgi:hypothetical protein
MEKIFDFKTESEFEDAYEDLLTSQDFKRLQNKYEIKPFYFKYKDLKGFFEGFSWFIQAITVAVSFMAIIALLSPMMPYPVAVCFAIGALLGVEFLKRATFKPTVKEWLQFKKVATFPLLISLGMLGVSLWLTYNGTHETVTSLSDAPTLLSVDSATAYEKDRIKQINADIATAKKITWQGKITEKGQKLIEKLTNERAKIQDKLDAKESDTKASNVQTTTDHQNKTLQRSTHFRFLTVCLDLLLFVLLAWLEYYDYRSLAEFAKLKTAVTKGNNTTTSAAKNNNITANNTPVTAANGSATANQIFEDYPISDNLNRVVIKGFLRSNNDSTAITAPTAAVGTLQKGKIAAKIKECAYCGNGFELTVYNKKYCCEEHKLKAWEQRTGRKFVPKLKKK